MTDKELSPYQHDMILIALWGTFLLTGTLILWGLVGLSNWAEAHENSFLQTVFGLISVLWYFFMIIIVCLKLRSSWQNRNREDN